MQFLDLTGVRSLWNAVKTRIENSKPIVTGDDAHATNSYVEVNGTETSTSNGSHYTYVISLHNVVSPTDLNTAKEALYGGPIPSENAESITSLNEKISELQSDSNVTVEKLTTAESGFLATYVVKQNGNQVGASINIPKDFLVKNGQVRVATADDVSRYPSLIAGESKVLDFIVNTIDGSGTDTHIIIPVNDLVDIYKAGTGIHMSDSNVVSVKIDETSEFLSIGENGIKVSGITTAINTAKNDVIGSNSDTSASNTVWGAKAYADSLSGNYATAAQGAKADTALQSVDTTVQGTNVKVNLDYDAVDNKKVVVEVDETALNTALNAKADKITGGTVGNFVTIDSTGNIVDSNTKPTDFATAEQGTAAQNAVKDVKVTVSGGSATSVVDLDKVANITISEGNANGTISVNSTDVVVHGLGSAAYTDANNYITEVSGGSSFGTSGNSNYISVLSSKTGTTVGLTGEVKVQNVNTASTTNRGLAEASDVKNYVDNSVSGLNSNQTYSVTSTTPTAETTVTKESYVKALTSVKVTEANGVLTTPSAGDVQEVSVDKAGAAKAAYDALLGNASTAQAGDRTIEGIYKEIGGGSVGTQITNAINALDSSVSSSGTASGNNVIAVQSANDAETQTAQYVLTKVVIENGLLSASSTSVKLEGIPTSVLTTLFTETPS